MRALYAKRFPGLPESQRLVTLIGSTREGGLMLIVLAEVHLQRLLDEITLRPLCVHCEPLKPTIQFFSESH